MLTEHRKQRQRLNEQQLQRDAENKLLRKQIEKDLKIIGFQFWEELKLNPDLFNCPQPRIE